MNLWKLSDKGAHVKFCWIHSHCGIDGNKAIDKLAKESLDLDIDTLLCIYHADLKPQVNTCGAIDASQVGCGGTRKRPVSHKGQFSITS